MGYGVLRPALRETGAESRSLTASACLKMDFWWNFLRQGVALSKLRTLREMSSPFDKPIFP
jgi:hypothetical protein